MQENESNESDKPTQDEQIREYGQVVLKANAVKHRIFLLSIIGEVEGHEQSPGNVKTTKYEHVLPQLAMAPIMIKFVLAGLEELGFSREQVYTTLELRMKCGIGKCGRCNIGSKYVCKDGPVFRCDEIDELPAEY